MAHTYQGNAGDLHFLLVGCAGSGKSATGNSILLGEYFEESSQAVSASRLTSTVTADPLKTGQRFTVTDTPDISETWLNIDNAEGMDFFSQISPGPHVILVVISARTHVSTEIEHKLKTLCDALGTSATRHMIIVFTSIDMLTKSSQSREIVKIEEYVSDVREKNSFVSSLLEKCDMRYIGFNNAIDPIRFRLKARDQLDKLLMEVSKITMMNDFRRYEMPVASKIEETQFPSDLNSASRDTPPLKLSEFFRYSNSQNKYCGTSRNYKCGLFLGTLTSGFGIFRIILSILLNHVNSSKNDQTSEVAQDQSFLTEDFQNTAVYRDVVISCLGCISLLGMYIIMRIYQQRKKLFIKSVKEPVVYGGLYGLLAASGSFVGFKHPAIIISGGITILYWGYSYLRRRRNNSRIKMIEID